jgi:hypothetical protein
MRLKAKDDVCGEYSATFTVNTETTPSDVLEDVAETQQDKNADYGDSWQKTAELKRTLSGGHLPHPQTDHELILDALYTRMMDKLARGYTLAFMNDEAEVDDEALADTFRDLAGYAAMAAAEVENNER